MSSPFSFIVDVTSSCCRYNLYGGNQDLKEIFRDTDRFMRYTLIEILLGYKSDY